MIAHLGQSLEDIHQLSRVSDDSANISAPDATPSCDTNLQEETSPDPEAQIGIITPLDESLSSTISKCTCLDCLKLFKSAIYDEAYWLVTKDGNMIHCRIPECNWTIKRDNSYPDDMYHLIDHEKRHFVEKRPDSSLACKQDYCKFTTKRESDLRRHYRTKHCSAAQRFSCPVLWCKYSGGNGFARKDKLTSHYKNMHQGKLSGGQSLRLIQPAIPALSALFPETAISETYKQDHLL